MSKGPANIYFLNYVSVWSKGVYASEKAFNYSWHSILLNLNSVTKQTAKLLRDTN